MKISVLAGFIGAMCLALASMPANAQATRTWVSGVGDDANPCSRTAPCKTFAGAISKTAAAGEINCIDPGGFGTLTITKSISIICGTSGDAGVLVSGTNGFVISALSTDIVYLEGLDFEGLNTGLSGIQINTAAKVSIVNCRVRGFTTAGINVIPSSGGLSLSIIDTIVADNPGEGIQVKPSATANVRGFMDRTRVMNNTGDGVFVNTNTTSGGVKFAVRDSESSNNGANGFGTFSGGSVNVMQINSSSVSNNSTGIAADGSGAVVRFTRSTITSNGTGVSQTAPGLAQSYVTNSVDGNGTPGTFGTISQE